MSTLIVNVCFVYQRFRKDIHEQFKVIKQSTGQLHYSTCSFDLDAETQQHISRTNTVTDDCSVDVGAEKKKKKKSKVKRAYLLVATG